MLQLDSLFTDLDKVTVKGDAKKSVSSFPKRDPFRKPMFRQNTPTEVKTQYADIEHLGIPFVVNQVIAYAVLYADVNDTVPTLTLMLAIAQGIGIETDVKCFNHLTFKQQLKAQIAFDKHLIPVDVHIGKSADVKKQKIASYQAVRRAYVVNPDSQEGLQQIVTPR